MPSPHSALEMRGISKSFAGNTVLTDVSLTVAHGEVLALLGENGAGKSTLMKILAGVHQPDGGEIFIDDNVVKIAYGYTVILVLSAVIAPTPDPMTFMTLAAPIIVLYEACILIVWVIDRRKQRAETLREF